MSKDKRPKTTKIWQCVPFGISVKIEIALPFLFLRLRRLSPIKRRIKAIITDKLIVPPFLHDPAPFKNQHPIRLLHRT